MKVHVHDNNHVPVEQNCLSEVELEPGKVLTLHLHRGECHPCVKGHCHDGSVNLLVVDGAMYVVLEGVHPPSLITLEAMEMDVPVSHAARRGAVCVGCGERFLPKGKEAACPSCLDAIHRQRI